MIYFILAAIFVGIFMYSLLAHFLHIPSFKLALSTIRSQSRGTAVKNNSGSFLSALAKPISPYIPLSMAKEVKYSRMLQTISVETPKEFVARLIVTFTFIAAFAIPLALINPYLGLIPLAIAVIAVFIIMEETKDKAKKQHQLAENEIPGFVETFTHSIKTNRNVLSIFDAYIQNYKDTPLSMELAKTVADMRTGNPDIALKRFEHRMNNPLLSQLIRGVLATMRGEDMTAYFTELVKKVHEIRKKLLTQKALKVVPKISTMSNIRAFWAIGVMLYIVGMGVLEYVKGMM